MDFHPQSRHGTFWALKFSKRPTCAPKSRGVLTQIARHPAHSLVSEEHPAQELYLYAVFLVIEIFKRRLLQKSEGNLSEQTSGRICFFWGWIILRPFSLDRRRWKKKHPPSPRQNSNQIWELRGQNPHCKIWPWEICLERMATSPTSRFGCFFTDSIASQRLLCESPDGVPSSIHCITVEATVDTSVHIYGDMHSPLPKVPSQEPWEVQSYGDWHFIWGKDPPGKTPWVDQSRFSGPGCWWCPTSRASSKSLRVCPCLSICCHGPSSKFLDLLPPASVPPVQKRDAQHMFLQQLQMILEDCRVLGIYFLLLGGFGDFMGRGAL